MFYFYNKILTKKMPFMVSSKFEAVNSTWLSSCQKHVRPIFEMKWRPRAFSRVYFFLNGITLTLLENRKKKYCYKFLANPENINFA